MQLISAFLLAASVIQASSPMTFRDVGKALHEKRMAEGRLDARDSGCDVPDITPGPVDFSIAAFDSQKAAVYRYRQQQGVNLGSWFVHEAWMTPSPFACAAGPQIAEIDIASGWSGVDNAQKVLENHWATWIQEDDFKYLASVGINTVRLPMGFWTLGGNFTDNSIFSDYAQAYENSWSYYMRAIQWAGENGIGVLVDLHGAYGSQNGQAHSGVDDGQTNLFTSQQDMDQTVAAWTYMAQNLCGVTNVVGIELLNEPQDADNLWDLYTRGIEAVRAIQGCETFPLYMHDAFDLNQGASFVGARTDFCVSDTHQYFVFSEPQESTPVTQLTQQIQSDVASSVSSATQTARGNLVVGEWGCALADGSTDVDNLQQATQAYCTQQATVYGASAPAFQFWAYDLEGCSSGDGDGWCFKGSVGNLLPATFFSYSGMTSSTGLTISGNSSSSSTSSSSASTSSSTPTSNSNSTSTDGTDSPESTSSLTGSSGSGSSSSSSSSSGSGQCSLSKRSTTVNRRRHHARGLDRGFGRHHRRGHTSGNGSSSSESSSSTTTSSASSSTSTSTSSNSSSSSSSGSGSTGNGQADGEAAAKLFASLGGSKLGFTQQYVRDVMGSSDDGYTSDFLSGVQTGEQSFSRKLLRRR